MKNSPEEKKIVRLDQSEFRENSNFSQLFTTTKSPFDSLFLRLARESSSSDWRLDSTEGDKTLDLPQLDPVLIYTPTGSTDSPPSTPAGSMESEPYEARDRLLSRSPRKKPNVFTVSLESSNLRIYWLLFSVFNVVSFNVLFIRIKRIEAPQWSNAARVRIMIRLASCKLPGNSKTVLNSQKIKPLLEREALNVK